MADNTHFITVEPGSLAPVAEQPDIVQSTQHYNDLLGVLERIEQNTTNLPDLLAQQPPNTVAMTVSPQQLSSVESSPAPSSTTPGAIQQTATVEPSTPNESAPVQQQPVEPTETSTQPSASENAQSDNQAQTAQRTFFDQLRESVSSGIHTVTGIGGGNQSDDNRRSLRESAGLTLGGPIAEAVQEVRNTVGEFRSNDQTNNAVQRDPITGQFLSNDGQASTEVEPTATTTHQQTVEALAPSVPEQAAQNTNTHTQTVEPLVHSVPAQSPSQMAQLDTVNTQTVTLLESAAVTAESHHQELITTIEQQSRGSNSGSTGQSGSLFGDDEGSDRERRRNRRGNRGSRMSRIDSRAGGFGKTMLKGVGRLAAPLTAIMAGGLKFNELKDNEDLSAGQKAVQVGSTATGALGGALGGAAAGAAIGSVVPVVGTVIGGALGAIAGGLGGEKLGEWFGETISGWMGDDEKPEAIKPESRKSDEQPLEKSEKTEAQKPVEQAANNSSRVAVVQVNAAPKKTASTTEPLLSEPNTVSAKAIELQHKPKPPQLIQTQSTTTDVDASKAAQQQMPGLDPKRFAQELAKAMGSQQQNSTQNNQPPVATAPGVISTEFDDTTLTLMAYDRI